MMTKTTEMNTACVYCDATIQQPATVCAPCARVEFGETCDWCDMPDCTVDHHAEMEALQKEEEVIMNKAITVGTEKQDVTITTREQALRMIKTTVYFHQFATHQEIKEFAKLQEVAALFGIDTNELVIATTDSQADHDNGWPLVYRWKNEPEKI